MKLRFLWLEPVGDVWNVSLYQVWSQVNYFRGKSRLFGAMHARRVE